MGSPCKLTAAIMLATSLVSLATLAAAVTAAPQAPTAYPAEPPQPYSYQYGVSDEYSGAKFAANEASDTKVVSGSYTVQLPDGRVKPCIPRSYHTSRWQFK